MRIAPPPRRALTEPLLPMINVVFLLRVFFLRAATLARPAPFALTPPEARSDTAPDSGALTLYLDAQGEAGFGDARGDDALASLGQAAEAARAQCGDCADTLQLRADANLPGEALADLLPQLSALGFANLALVVRAK
jgi:biopolymer transport protein ExbD